MGFIRPTITKIIAALILSIVFVPFINHDNGIRCFTTPCPADSTSSLAVYLVGFHQYTIYNVYWINIVIGLIVSYIISCMIVYAVAYVYRKIIAK